MPDRHRAEEIGNLCGLGSTPATVELLIDATISVPLPRKS